MSESKAVSLIHDKNSMQVEEGISMFKNLMKSDEPYDYDEIYNNLALGYFRLGDLDGMAQLREENPNSERINRIFYDLQTGITPGLQSEIITTKNERNKSLIVRNTSIVVLAASLLTALFVSKN